MTPDERLAKLRPPMLHRIASDRHATPELRARARAELERRARARAGLERRGIKT